MVDDEPVGLRARHCGDGVGRIRLPIGAEPVGISGLGMVSGGAPEREHVGREATSLEHRGKMAVVGTGDETASSPRLRQHIGQRQAPHQMSAADPMASVDSEHDVQKTILAVE
jgi:hypothetical protein